MAVDTAELNEETNATLQTYELMTVEG